MKAHLTIIRQGAIKMADIHQSLFDPKIEYSEVVPSGVIKGNFLTLGQITEEEGKQIVNVHCSGVSFGIPTSALDEIRELPLDKHPGGYIAISGHDVDGKQKEYAIKIDDETKDRLAWNIFTALGVVHGQTFIRDNAAKWKNWFAMKKISPDELKNYSKGKKIVVRYHDKGDFQDLEFVYNTILTGIVTLISYNPSTKEITFENKDGNIKTLIPDDVFDPT